MCPVRSVTYVSGRSSVAHSPLLLDNFRQGPGEDHAAISGHHILAFVQFVSNRRSLHADAGAGVPQSLAVTGIESENIAGIVASESQARVGAEDARAGLASHFVAPSDFAGLIVNGFDDPFAPDCIVRAGPTVSAVGGFGEVDRPTRVSGNDEQSGPGIETGGAVVGETGLVGGDQPAVRSRFFGRIGNRASVFIHPQSPVHWAIGQRQETLSSGPIQHEEVAVA